MRKNIPLRDLKDVTAFTFGERYNHKHQLDPDGFLVCQNARPVDEPLAMVVANGEVFWDVDDDYIATAPLYGRPFIYTVFDCFTFMRDWFQRERGVEIPLFEYPSDWWHIGQNLYRDNAAAAGFQVIQPPLQVGDVIGIRQAAGVMNHTAVYVGDGNIAHHRGAQFSKIEPFRRAYLRDVVNYYRHEALA